MKKKKLLAAFAAAAVLAVGGGALAGCNEEHKHTYSDGWEKDSVAHWHVATCDDLKEGDKDYTQGYAEHVWGDDDECDVCGYTKTPVSTEVTVKLNANGGTLEGNKETADVETKDGKLETLPTPTAPEGMEFVGWYTKEDGGTQVTTSTAFTANATIYAQYIFVYTITLDANGGTLETTTLKARDGKITELPVPTAPEGKQFAGWYTAADGGEIVTVATEFDEDTTIYARYASVYTITLQVGEKGTLPEGTETTLTTKGGRLESLPTPVTESSVMFIGWYTAEEGGEQVTTDTLFTGEELTVTLYARYGQEIAVTFNAGTGALPEGVAPVGYTTEGKIAELPTPVAPENYWFKGWYTAETDGVLVKAGTDLTGQATDNAVTLYAHYVAEVTVTLNVGDAGTLPEGAATTYKTVNGKIQLPEGSRGLPALVLSKEHWVFFGWYNGNTAVNELTQVFETDTTLTAKVGRENGVWVGETFKNALTLNAAASRTEYWLGGSQITLQKGDSISLYIDGVLIRHYVESNSAGIVKPDAASQVNGVEVSVAGPFSIYLHKNASDWSCEYSGPTELNIATEVPAGCDAFKVKIGTNEITFYLKDSDGKAVSSADFGKFCIYTYEDEIFGNWAGSTTKGVLSAEMTVSASKIPNGWIFRWGSGYGQQTSNIIGVFKNGKTYIIELPSTTNGDAKVSELSLTKYTVTLDQNYEGQPEEKATMEVAGGKYTLPAEPVRDDYDFAGWYTAAEGGTLITEAYAFGEDTTIYAHWTAKIQITLNYNYDGSTAGTVKANHGKLSPLPTATREGYYLIGWFTEAEEGTKITVNTVFEEAATIYAHWGVRVDATVTVNYNYEGCAEPETIPVTTVNGNKIIPFPVAPEREGYEFLGWYTTAEDTEEEAGELITEDSEIHSNITIYARYALVHTVTLSVDANGTLPDGAVTTYKVLNGKIVLPDGATGLPTVTVSKAHWKFLGWYDGNTAVNIATAVFDKDTTLTAKVVREDGVWKGETFVYSLTINTGSTSRTEYWLGGSKITLAKGDKISLYLNGIVINHYVEQNSAGIDVPAASAVVGEVTVTVAGEFEIYLHRNASDYSCEYSGPTEVAIGSEIPAGCAPVHVTWGSSTNKQELTFFLIDADGNPVGIDDLGSYALYTYSPEIFGTWQNGIKNGNSYLKPEMTSTTSGTPGGWIFRWSDSRVSSGVINTSTGNDGCQTSNIIGAFTSGKTYLIKLPKGPTTNKEQGAATITELDITTKYTITLDQNYEGKGENTTVTAYNGKLTYMPSFVRAGYEDKDMYWYTAAEGGEKVTYNTVFTADTTVYARWSDKVQVTPNYNYEGADTAEALKANLGKLSSLPANPTREGYEFLGWFTAAEGGERVTTETVFDADSQIYAHWRVPFTVTFNLNYEGCAAAEVKTANVVAGETYSKLSTLGTNPTREGYEFLGWFSAAEDGDRITVSTQYTENTNIYAHWRVPFKVTFDLNYEGSAEATVKNANVVSGQTYSRVPSADIVTPVREGYDFLGWYPNADGTGTKITTSTNITGDITYYASWRLPIEVTFDLNYEGCDAATKKTATLVANQVYSRFATADIPVPAAREGYDFLGWYPNVDGSGTKLVYTTNLTENTTYYASWRLYIEVTFDLNYEGCAAATKQTATLVANQTYSRITALPADPVREGYDFLGWYNTTAASGGTKLATTTNLTANDTYYARWREVIKVTLDLNYDGAAEPTVVLASLYSASATAAYSRVTAAQIADPVRTGYDFGGWYTVAAASGGTKLATTTNLTAHVTYYARWTAGKTVTFDLNYTGQPTPMQTATTTNKLITLPANPTREGYEFTGWFTTSTGTTAVTATRTYTSNTTIYAHWKALPVVTFDINDGEEHETNATLTVNAEKKLTAFITEPTREGYTFAGWYTAAEDGEEITLEKAYTADTTVYAHWTAVTTE